MAELKIPRASDCPRMGTVTLSQIELYDVGTVREGQSPDQCSYRSPISVSGEGL